MERDLQEMLNELRSPEAIVLRELASRPGTVVRTDDLLVAMYGRSKFGLELPLDGLLSHLATSVEILARILEGWAQVQDVPDGYLLIHPARDLLVWRLPQTREIALDLPAHRLKVGNARPFVLGEEAFQLAAALIRHDRPASYGELAAEIAPEAKLDDRKDAARAAAASLRAALGKHLGALESLPDWGYRLRKVPAHPTHPERS